MLYEWTPELAYAIGLITTDGWLSSDGRHLGLTSSDIQLLKTFRDCLNLKNKIIKNPKGGYVAKKQAYRITFGNVEFYKWLEKIGLRKNKTCFLGKLEIPRNFWADFLRGHLDGDGSIITYIDRYLSYKGKRDVYKRIYTAFLSSTYPHIEWIQSILKEILGIKGSLSGWKHKRPNAKVILWRLRFAKKDSLKLLPWLYYKPNLPCLRRKRKIAKRFLKRFCIE